MQKVFEISLPEHLVKFAVDEWFKDQNPPFFLTEKHRLGREILSILNDKREKEYSPYIEHSSSLKVELSDTLAKRSPDLIKLSRLEYILESILKEHCLIFVKGASSGGMHRYPAVEFYLKSKGIESDDLKVSLYNYVTYKINDQYKKYAEEKKNKIDE